LTLWVDRIRYKSTKQPTAEYDTLRYHRREERKFSRGCVCCARVTLHNLVLPPVPQTLHNSVPGRHGRPAQLGFARWVRTPTKVGEKPRPRRRGDVSTPRLDQQGGRLRQEQKAGVARHAPCVMLETSRAKHLALPRLFGGLKQTEERQNGLRDAPTKIFPTSHMYIS
jgi:hypothetical protein